MAATQGRDGRYLRSNHKRNPLRKDIPVFNHQLAHLIHQDRQREIELRLARLAAAGYSARATRQPSRSLRQRLGRGVMKLGAAIAADRTRATRIVRDPCGAPGELAARQ
jgi:hypothetical protein